MQDGEGEKREVYTLFRVWAYIPNTVGRGLAPAVVGFALSFGYKTKKKSNGHPERKRRISHQHGES